MIKALLVLLLILDLAGCASAPLSQEFSRIRIGMEKDRVLEIMGPPTVHRRVRSKDVYTYKFYENDLPILKEIQLENGQVIYAGEVTRPEESAEEADERIKRDNEAYQQQQKKRSEERRKSPNVEKEILKDTKPKVPNYREI